VGDESIRKPQSRRRATLDDAYLPLEELATYAGISVRTLRDYLHHPVTPLPHYVIQHKILVRRSTFDEWIERFLVADAPTDINARLDAMVKGA
jgi:Helix-turn-helix domain